jgi:hypothetical protein
MPLCGSHIVRVPSEQITRAASAKKHQMANFVGVFQRFQESMAETCFQFGVESKQIGVRLLGIPRCKETELPDQFSWAKQFDELAVALWEPNARRRFKSI